MAEHNTTIILKNRIGYIGVLLVIKGCSQEVYALVEEVYVPERLEMEDCFSDSSKRHYVILIINQIQM